MDALSPRLLKGGIVLADATTGIVQRVVVLQYNPDTLTRTLQVQGIGAESGDRLEVMRLKGPPIETFKLDAEIDATDQLEVADANAPVTQYGLYPTLAALEIIVYPDSARLISNNSLAQAGTLEIVPVEAPMTLFVWSKTRVIPVRLTEFSITEEAFDEQLNPIRAKVSLGMRVMTVMDLGFDHKGGSLYMVHQQQKERLAKTGNNGSLSAFGIGGIQ